ncbi:MAG: effector binding domain-containing protein [Oscillospiraceae bacterium]|nr:effector binding domain-containing protein [Oscillospiraceae bacterium]
MLRIGEAAKQFSISNRTLRYWEETGILKSARSENGYRFYDGENAARIGQIALVESLIGRIREAKDLKQVFICLEAHDGALAAESAASQILLSERVLSMPEENLKNVRIVKLPAMTVASYRAESASPERDCSEVFNPFVLENHLHKRDGFRFLGFNNPSPSQDSPVYGYEMWVTVPEGFDVPEPLVKKHFGGGLYASVSTHMNEIGERWGLLHNWVESSGKYEVDFSFQWLEECCMDFETFISDSVPDSEKQLDLLEPVKLK